MVLIHLQIAFAANLQGQTAVVHELVQHMVEKFQAGINGALPSSVQIHFNIDIGLGGLALYHCAALTFADFFRRPGPTLRGIGHCVSRTVIRSGTVDAQETTAQIAGQFLVRIPVADDKTGAQIVRAVQIGAEHSGTRLARGSVVFGKTPVNQFIGKDNAFARQDGKHLAVRRVEIFLRIGRGAESVLVGSQHQLIIEGGDAPKGGNRAGHKLHFLETVNLFVSGFAEDGPVPVDKNHFSHT